MTSSVQTKIGGLDNPVKHGKRFLQHVAAEINMWWSKAGQPSSKPEVQDIAPRSKHEV